jgi:DNA-binding CsgD family transcriptional regulator
MATAINDPFFTSRGKSMDLSRLNKAERRVLGLLAEGHTAKSIANTIGSTPAAVNERLREARRKTGVGSSRELARLLKAQENRDEQIEVGNRHRVAADMSPGAAEPWRPKTGVYAMIGLFLVAAAGAAALLTHQPAAKPPADPLVGALLKPVPEDRSVADLYTKVRSGPRGPWATRTEQQIKTRLMSLPLVGKNGNVLRVTCGSSLCEIAGTVIVPQNKAETHDQRSQFNRTARALQIGIPDALAKLRLNPDAANFTSGSGKPDKLTFLLYYSRAKIGEPIRHLPPPPEAPPSR